MGKLGEIFVRFRGDTKSLDKSIDKSEKKVKGFGKSVKGLGGVMAGVFAAGLAIKGIARIGSALLQAASDAEETKNKFDVVFQSVSEAANKVATDLVNNYGLAQQSSEDLLSSTGDLLTGLGMTGVKALDLSEKVNKLAIDLASFTNFSGGAIGASNALTKALLGERESVKSLGIVITEAMVKENLRLKGLKDLTGIALQQAKAEATLEIAYSQSKNALGDYARTSESYANVSRRLTERLKDVKAQMGEKLLPVVNSFKKALIGLLPILIKGFEKAQTAIVEVINYFIDLYNESIAFRVVVQSLGAVFKSSFAFIKGILKNFVNVIGGVGKLIKAAFTLNFKAIPGIIKETFKEIAKDSAEAGNKIIDSFAKGIRNAKKDKIVKAISLDKQEEAKVNQSFTESGVKAAEAFATAFIKTRTAKLANQKLGQKDASIASILKGGGGQIQGLPFKLADSGKKREVEDMTDALVEQISVFGALSDAAEAFSMTLSQAYGDVEGSLSGFVSVFANSARKIIKIQLAKAIAGTVEAALTKSGVPPPFNLVLAAGSGLAAAALFEGLVPSFAQGGFVPSPTLAMIGDAPGGEYILNKGQMAGLMGSRDINVNGVIRGNDIYLSNNKAQDFHNRT